MGAALGAVYVSSAAELLSALQAATAGTTILLAPGNYGDLSLNSTKQPWAEFAGEVTIKSYDAGNPATFTSVQLSGVQNLTFDGVTFDYVSAEGAPEWTHPFYVTGSTNITIKNSIFDGDLAHGVNEIVDGYGTGYGLGVVDSTNITIENNEFFNWMRAGVFNTVENLIVKGNDVHDIRSDGFDFADVDHVLIEGNYIHDFRAAEGSGDHRDMIQFWTNGTTSPSTDIIIRGNFLDSGSGSYTQSIFMRNDLVDRGLAGLEMYYQNITIENNVIYNSHTHGITVGETIGLTIQNNTILQNPASAPDAKSVYIPSIHVKDASQDVLIANNILPSVYNPQLASSTGERTLTGNFFAQSSDPQAANYVGDLFVNPFAGASATLADLKAVLGSIVDQMNVGAAMTQPEFWSGSLPDQQEPSQPVDDQDSPPAIDHPSTNHGKHIGQGHEDHGHHDRFTVQILDSVSGDGGGFKDGVAATFDNSINGPAKSAAFSQSHHHVQHPSADPHFPSGSPIAAGDHSKLAAIQYLQEVFSSDADAHGMQEISDLISHGHE